MYKLINFWDKIKTTTKMLMATLKRSYFYDQLLLTQDGTTTFDNRQPECSAGMIDLPGLVAEPAVLRLVDELVEATILPTKEYSKVKRK